MSKRIDMRTVVAIGITLVFILILLSWYFSRFTFLSPDYISGIIIMYFFVMMLLLIFNPLVFSNPKND